MIGSNLRNAEIFTRFVVQREDDSSTTNPNKIMIAALLSAPRCLGLFVTCVLLMLASLASAFPPAPTFTIHGVARDPFGWSLRATDRATVVLKVNGTVIATAPVSESARAGENFRLAVPMDTRPSDPYRTGAQTTGNLFSIEVRLPKTTMPVAFLNASQNKVGKPGEMLFVDFTIGEDSDGDGIPDAWEWWQLSEMGIGPGDPLWSLNTFGKGDFDGNGTPDYIEYLAGTFAFLSEEKLELKITGFDENRNPRLAAFVVTGKAYRVERTTDLNSWQRIPVRLDSDSGESVTTFTVNDTREAIIRPAEAPLPKAFYRLVLVR
jgi:hypothetical protein